MTWMRIGPWMLGVGVAQVAWAQDGSAPQQPVEPEAPVVDTDAAVATEDGASDEPEVASAPVVSEPTTIPEVPVPPVAPEVEPVPEDTVASHPHGAWLPEPCAAWPAASDGGPRTCWDVPRSGTTFMVSGQARAIGTVYPDFPVDDEGTEVGQGPTLDQRLRLSAGVGWHAMTVSTEWDLFTGQVAGDPWDIEGQEDARRRDRMGVLHRDSFVPRRAAFDLVLRDKQGRPVPWLIAQGGLMPATWWGLGILANGGDRDALFGRVDRGDRMLRARVSVAPIVRGQDRLPLYFTVGGDLVIEDDTAQWASGQRAYHVIASVLWRGPDATEAGVFFTQRVQREAGDAPRPTVASVVDVYAAGVVPLGAGGWALHLATEDALIAGRTERSLGYAFPEGSRLLSGALVAHAHVDAPGGVFRAHVRGGWTSATGDPDQGSVHDFTLDANHNVGLVLFDELMGGIEAGTWALLNDETLTGGPPQGAEALVTEGSVRRAAWVWPILEGQPLDWLRVRGGYLAAWSTGPIAQPFYTARAGGVPTNHLDRPTAGRFMGHELQWGVDLGVGPRTQSWRARPSLMVEGGLAFPSDDLGGGRLALVRATARVDF